MTTPQTPMTTPLLRHLCPAPPTPCSTTHPMQHQPPHAATLPLPESTVKIIYVDCVRVTLVPAQPVPQTRGLQGIYPWLAGYIPCGVRVRVGVWVPRGLPVPLPNPTTGRTHERNTNPSKREKSS